MKKLEIYDIDTDTGELLQKRTIQRHAGVGLPANCVEADKIPPDCPSGYVLCWRDNKCVTLEDHRGETYYIKDSGEAVEIKALGPIPNTLTSVPPVEFGVWDDASDSWTEDTVVKAEAMRAKRDALLTSCDWTQLPDSPLSVALRAEWATYRQALRDITTQGGFPHDVLWPVAPDGA